MFGRKIDVMLKVSTIDNDDVRVKRLLDSYKISQTVIERIEPKDDNYHVWLKFTMLASQDRQLQHDLMVLRITGIDVR